MNDKLYQKIVGLALGLLFLLPFGLLAQTTDTWTRVNRGFAKCAVIGGFAGEAEWYTDDFDVQRMVNRRGEMFAYIAYGNDGTNTTNCNAGLFRYDTVANRWFKVANNLSNTVYLYTNNTEIIAVSGYPNNAVYRYTTDLLNFPNGWQTIASLRWDQIPNNGCQTTQASNGIGGDLTAYVGDTLYVVQYNPCGNSNQVVKYFVGGNYVVEFPQDIYVEILGDMPFQGIAQNNLRSSTHFYSFDITEPIGGFFKYFQHNKYLNADFEITDYLWTWDPRRMPSALYPGMLPFRTDIVANGSDVFFVQDDGNNGYELFKTNGTQAGTSLVRDLNTNADRNAKGGYRRYPKNMTPMGAFTYFSGYGNTTGQELYRTDGTSGGTTLVRDINTGNSSGEPNNSNPENFVVIGSTLFFTATTNANGTELWRTDGTSGGTVLVTDINPGSSSSSPANLTVIGTTLFFSAAGSGGDRELYKCEAPYTSAVLIRNINSTGSSDPQQLFAHDGILFFSATDGVTGRELWKSESPFNSGSTSQIRNIWAGSGGSTPKNFFSFGSRLVFQANDSLNGAEIWTATAPYSTASLWLNINTSPTRGSFPGQFVAINDTLFFRANDGFVGFELYKTGGTVASTRRIADINTTGSSSPSHLTVFDNRVYFTANNNTGGRELYYTSQAPYNSVVRVELAAGAASSDPINFRVIGSRLYFTANDNVNGWELWSLTAGNAPTMVSPVSKSGAPYGWRNISKGPDYGNLTGSSNPFLNTDPGFDPTDSDTWQVLRPTRPQNRLAESSTPIVSFDKKQMYIGTQTGVYRWIGSGWEWVLAIREPYSFIPTNYGNYLSTRSGIRRISGAVTQQVGNADFYPTCVHAGIRNFATPDDGKTLFCVKFDMIDPLVCGWGNGQGAEMGIYTLKINDNKPGATRNLALTGAGYIGGSEADHPVGVGWGGRPAPNANRKPELYVAGNFPVIDNALRNRRPATNVTFSSGGYTTTTSAKAVLLHFSSLGDTLKRVIYLGTNSNDEVHDFEYINQRPAAGIGRRMAITGTFGLTVVDSVGNLIYNIPNASLPGSQSGRLIVDIDRNGHVVVMRSNAVQYSHPFLIYDENGQAITGVTTAFRQFANDIAIQNDTVVITGFRNGCLPSTPPYCNGAGGNTGGCGGAEIQTAYIYYYKRGNSTSDPMVIYGKTYDFPDGAQGRDVADTRGYLVSFGADGNLYFAGESAGSESIYRWPGIENSTVELNSVRLGVCDGTSNTPNGSLSFTGLRAVSTSDLSNTASAHICFIGKVNYRNVTPGGYLEVERGQWLIPRLGDGKSNTFKLSGNDGYLTADSRGAVYLNGSSSFQFDGRPSQKVNGQLIGEYSGDATIMVTNDNFGGRRFWGTLTKPLNGTSGPGGNGVGRQMAILDTLVAYVARIDTFQMHTFNPAASLTSFGMRKAKPDGYLAVFHADLSKYANRDSIVETVRQGDTIIPPDFTRLKANFNVNRSTVCVVPGSNNTVAFTDASTLLNPATNTNWSWRVSWDFGQGYQLVSGMETFQGTANNLLSGYTPPTVRWTTTGLKTITLRIRGTHPTFDSVSFSEVKYNFINVLPTTANLTTMSGAGSTCNGGVADYEAIVDQTLSFGITSYVWTVPSGATILTGQGSRRIRVRFGASSGNVSVYGVMPCGNTATLSRSVTITTPVREALMIAGSMSLSTGETAIRQELINRGYNVLLREDNDLDTLEFYCKNLVVVTASVDASLIGDRLRRLATPVVVMNPAMLPNMAMTGSTLGTDFGTATGQTQINVTNAGPNDLLGGMTTGNNTVFSPAGYALGWGNPNNNAVKIANVVGQANQTAYFAFNTGAVMNNSYAAPARRVFFFPGNRLAIDSLNALGRTLVGRAICYADNNCNIPTITVQAPSRNSFYPFDSVSFRFTTAGTFNSGNVFTIQWSDRFGDFSNPTNTTTQTLSGVNPTFRLVQDPMPTLTAGTQYAVRITSSNPATFSNTITGITLFDALTGPAKILYLTNAQGPTAPLDARDTAIVAALRRTGYPVDYCRRSDFNNLRMAGAKLIVVGPLCDFSASANTMFNTLRVVNIPVLLLANQRLISTGLSLTSAEGYPNVSGIDSYGFNVPTTSPFSGLDGFLAFHNPNASTGIGNFYVSDGLPSVNAVVTARWGIASNSSIAAFHYEAGSVMANSVTANARRGWFGIDATSQPRFNTLSVEARTFFDRFVRYLIGDPAVEITYATVSTGGALCTNSEVTVNMTGSTGFNPENRFFVELSSPIGNFNDPGFPILLASRDAQAPLPITFTIPTGLASSDRYRMRIRSSSPERTLIVNDTTLTVMMDDRRATTRSSNLPAQVSGYDDGWGSANWNIKFRHIYDPTTAFYGNSYMEVTGTTASEYIRFTPNVVSAGNYEVQVIYPALASPRTSATFVVVHAGGTTNVTINQSLNTNRWVRLGSFNFTAGTNGYIQINGDQTNLRVDAIRLVRNVNHPNRATPGGDKNFTVGNIWTGLADNNWHNPANWSLCNATATGVPDSTTQALIPSNLSNAANFPIISAGDAEVRNLTIANGDGKLWIRNGRTLRATVSLSNEDTLRFFENANLIGSGTRPTNYTNNSITLVDDATLLRANVTNQGTFSIANYAGTAQTRISSLTNTTTGTFLTNGAQRVRIDNGLTSSNTYTLAAGTIFFGDITQSAGTGTINRLAFVSGNVALNGGSINFNTTTSGDSTTVNGTLTIAASTSVTWGANRMLRLKVNGGITNNGTFTISNGTNGDRPLLFLDADLVNNGSFYLNSSSGGSPGLNFRTIVNNGLFEVSQGNTNFQRVVLAGTITNNGQLLINGTQNQLFEFDEITNSGIFQTNKQSVFGRRFVNTASGTALLGSPYSSGTIQRQNVNVTSIDNAGTLRISEFSHSSNGTGFLMNVHDLINRSGGTLEIARVTGSGTNNGRTVICHGNFTNDGTMTLNADLNMASKIGRTQEIKGVTAVNTLTVSNLATAADTGYSTQFDVGRRNLLYGNWTTTDDAFARGGRRYVSAASSNPDSAVLNLIAPQPGFYNIQIWAMTNSGRRPSGTPHRVFANNTWYTYSVDQRTNGATWFTINSTPVYFSGSMLERLVIGGIAHTDGSFGADAARLVYVSGGTAPVGGGVQLGSPLTVNTNLNLETNKLKLRTNNLTIASGATISNVNSSRYVVTANAANSGRLIQTVAASEVNFPVGIDTSYSPVAITNGGNQAIGVNVVQGVQMNVTSGSYVADSIVDRTWLINPVSTAAGATLKFTWNATGITPSNELNGFNRASSKLAVIGSTTSTWANLGTPTISGANPYTGTVTGVTLDPNESFAVSSGNLVSQDRTWNGSVSSAWNVAGNWTPSGVPTAFSRVIIPGSVPNNPIISTGSYVCLELEITTGNLTISGGTLTVNGNFIRRAGGTFSNTGGTVVMAGSAGTSIVGSNSFANLTISNGTGVTMPNLATTVGNLTISSSGRLILAADSSNTQLNITGNWINGNGGSFTQSAGVIAFTGSAAQQIQGINKFHHLTINNSSGGVTLVQNDTITGTLTLTNGNIILGNNDLVMLGASAAIAGGSASSYVQTSPTNSGGSMLWVVGGVERTFPVGTNTYTPVALTNGNNKWHRVRVYNGVTDNGPVGAAITSRAVNRTWFIEPDYSREDILMDNGNPGYTYVNNTETPTNFNTSNGTGTGGWGGTYWTMNNNNASLNDYTQVMPNFQTTGNYEIFAYFPPESNCSSITYQIFHANGQTNMTYTLAGRSNTWFSLGTYQFNAGSSPTAGAIRITASTGGCSRVVDAFRFNFRGAVGVGTTVKLQWNSSDELVSFDANRVKMGAHSGSSPSWLFQNNYTVSGTNPKQSTVTGVGVFPYFCIGGWGTNQWVGGVDSSWTNPNNWSIAVPGPEDDVIIPQLVNSNRGPRIGTGDVATARSLTLMGGTNGRLRMAGGVLNLTGNLTNNGVFTHTGGKVILSGTQPATITGANAFNRLEIRNGNGVTLPTSTTTVADSFIVNNGTMTMNGGVLTVNGSVTLANSSSRLVMNDGVLTVRGNLNNTNGGQIISASTAGSVDLAGTSAQSVTGNNVFRNLTISNTSVGGVTFSGADSVRVLRDLTVNFGSRLTMASGRLVVLNNLVGNGTMTLTGSTTELRGNSVQTLFGTPSFGNLVINKNGGSITVPSVLTTTGEFFVQNGTVALPGNANYTLQTLRMGSGGALTMNGGTLSITGAFNNTAGGTFIHQDGQVAFTGTAKGSILGNVDFDDLRVNKTGTATNDSVVVSNTVNVRGLLTLTRGYLKTADNGLLNLQNTATMTNETNTARVVGRLTQSLTVNGSPITFAGSVVSINPGLEQLGLVEVTRISGLGRPGVSYATTPEFPTSKSIDALWFIEPQQQPAAPVSFTLRWNTALDNGNSRGLRMYAYKRSAPYTGNWIKVSNTPITVSNDQTTITTESFSQWTIGDQNNPLPVELGNFYGVWNAKAETVDLTWFTLSEKDNSHFVVERSNDQFEWTQVGTVQGRGTTYVNTRYNFSDPGALKGLNYYRLIQVDYNGQQTKSHMIAVQVGETSSNWRMYPNPTYNNLTLEAYGLEGGSVALTVTDMLGRAVAQDKLIVQPGGVVKHRLSLQHLPAGVYSVKVTDEMGNTRNSMIEKK